MANVRVERHDEKGYVFVCLDDPDDETFDGTECLLKKEGYERLLRLHPYRGEVGDWFMRDVLHAEYGDYWVSPGLTEEHNDCRRGLFYASFVSLFLEEVRGGRDNVEAFIWAFRKANLVMRAYMERVQGYVFDLETELGEYDS